MSSARGVASLASAAALAPAALPRRSRNWALAIGIALVIVIFCIAVVGPHIAPRDPMETNFVMRVEGEFLRAPFPPLTVPGLPLGSDHLGRDLVSRLLWAVRPTLLVVLMVAAIRLVMGTTIGAVAGWATGRARAILDGLIESSLAVPVLVVALAVVAIAQPMLGVWAFVLALSLTGWAETAQLTREQTRAVKHQVYVEAAHALGASSGHIVFRHVLRQIMPMLWMLFSFEISGTLLSLAALGFLGYYVGGEIWVPIADFVAARETGMPELGQMLQTTSQDLFTGPWKIFAAGGVVFLIVLGFNLLGEGLRARALRRQQHRSPMSELTERASGWVEAQVVLPLTSPGPQRRRIVMSILLFTVVAGASLALQQTLAARGEGSAPPVSLAIPGGHLWASERGDAFGTLWRDVAGPAEPAIEWTFTAPGGLAGGPVITEDGTLYIAGRDGRLYALDPMGMLLRETSVSATPVGSPALGAEGQLYLSDSDGGLIALSSDGTQLWHYAPGDTLPARAGPIVASNGTLYYAAGSQLLALSAEGQPLWREVAALASVPVPPQLHPEEDLVILDQRAFHARDGSPFQSETLDRLNPRQLFVGGDGRSYLRTPDVVAQWSVGAGDIDLGLEANWEMSRFAGINPRDAGTTRSSMVWMVAYGQYQDARLFWMDMERRQMLPSVIFPHRPARVIGADVNDVIYVCGTSRMGGNECLGFAPGQNAAWQVMLDSPGEVVGGALVQDRLYVATSDGTLYAIGNGNRD
jgi:ABC-type dipeptide/oligopeptide/nickel transport system permease subunit